MIRTECPREQEVLDAITAGRWPEKLGNELSQHVSSCTVCADLGLVAQAFNDDCQAAFENVRVPSAGLVWWKAELRARREAVRTANRPINIAQWAAAGSGFLIAVLVLFWMVDFSVLPSLSLGALLPEVLPAHLIYLALGGVGVVASVAAYFVLSDE